MNNLDLVIVFVAIFSQIMNVELTKTKFLRHNNRKNTLIDFLAPEQEKRGEEPGEAKVRSKRRDLSDYASIASIPEPRVMALVFQAYLNVFLATLRQGRPPLEPKFPKSIIWYLRKMIDG